MSRKICVITGTRAEYGLLSRLMYLIKQDLELQLQIVVTNMHLSLEHGLTYQEIESDGFVIDKKVYMLLSSDTDNATVKSMGLAMIGFADAFTDLKPDLIVVLGDRYEMLSVVASALIFKIPVAHLYGGEVTEGAYDEAIRHSITKMSHLHFTSTEEYRKRVIQLGENPERVFNVGALGVENIKKSRLLSKSDFDRSIDFSIGDNFFLITYHPVTLDKYPVLNQIQALLSVLDKYPDYKLLFTLPNSDTDGHLISKCIEEYVAKNKGRAILFASLGRLRYLSALKYASAVIGNSSSGIVEAPSFNIPTLNIGDRQKGRIMGDTIYNCSTMERDIYKGMKIILSDGFRAKAKNAKNPYEKENTAENILNQLKFHSLDDIVQKSFYNITQ